MAFRPAWVRKSLPNRVSPEQLVGCFLKQGPWIHQLPLGRCQPNKERLPHARLFRVGKDDALWAIRMGFCLTDGSDHKASK